MHKRRVVLGFGIHGTGKLTCYNPKQNYLGKKLFVPNDKHTRQNQSYFFKKEGINMSIIFLKRKMSQCIPLIKQKYC